MKVFRTSNRQLVTDCLVILGFSLPNECVAERLSRFTAKFHKGICKMTIAIFNGI